MDQPRKDKILFTLTLLAALFTLQPILADFKTSGYMIGTISLSLERLYYVIGLLLGCAVYFYATNFVTERFSFVTRRLGDFFYALAIVTLPAYFLLWGLLAIATPFLTLWKSLTFRAVVSGLLGGLIGAISTVIAAYISTRVGKRDRQKIEEQWNRTQIKDFESASQMFDRGYYDLAVFDLNHVVSSAMTKLLIRHEVAPDPQRRFDKAATARAHKLLSEEAVHSIELLRSLRNQVLHTDKKVTKESADEAFQVAKKVLAEIDRQTD